MDKDKNKYKNHIIKSILIVITIFALACLIITQINVDGYIDYVGEAKIPSCMKLTEYGNEGNEEGCIRNYRTVTADYTEIYGLQFQIFHMIDIASASLKYQHLIEEIRDSKEQSEKDISNNKKVTTLISVDNITYVVEDETTVYIAYESQETYSRHQRWFNNLEIDYQTINPKH